MTPGELEQFIVGMGQPKFRAKQIAEWLGRGAPDFSVMKNLPENLRLDLARAARTLPVEIETKLESSDGQTTKFLLKLNDGEVIETVLMRTTYGNSVCVSSQAGCAMGCKFCASTLLGLRRNLTMNEMSAQVLVAQWELRSSNFKLQTSNLPKANGDANNGDVSHIVVMGTGEPLQNTENVLGFLEYANVKLGISWRRMTLSASGIVPGIEQLTEWGRPINLAISLHAPTDELRGKLMPINAKYPIAAVLDAAFANSEKTGRQLMIEYLLLDAAHQEESRELRVESREHKNNANLSQLSTLNSQLCNCSPEHALQLSELLRGKNVMVNLIPWNAVSERSEWATPSGNAVHRFQDMLIQNGIHTRIRRERGADIASACGQLRLNSVSGSC